MRLLENYNHGRLMLSGSQTDMQVLAKQDVNTDTTCERGSEASQPDTLVQGGAA